MADDDFIGEVVGGSSFDDQIAKFMRTPQFSALLAIATGAASSSAQSAGAASGGLPVGSVTAFSGEALPANYLWCDGSTFEPAVYPELREVLGVRYIRPGDPGSVYRVPDLRGRVPVGVGNDSTAPNNASRTLGASGGDTRMQTHTHVQNAHTHIQDAHGHSLGGGQSFGTNFGPNAGGVATFGLNVGIINTNTYQGPYSATATTATNQNTTATNQNAGAGSGENMPPFHVVNFIIKAR